MAVAANCSQQHGASPSNLASEVKTEAVNAELEEILRRLGAGDTSPMAVTATANLAAQTVATPLRTQHAGSGVTNPWGNTQAPETAGAAPGHQPGPGFSPLTPTHLVRGDSGLQQLAPVRCNGTVLSTNSQGLPSEEESPGTGTRTVEFEPLLDQNMGQTVQELRTPRRFWKAGEYAAKAPQTATIRAGGIDHARIHPKFLHSNATSHKWALGALAELLDNAMDEVANGATFVRVDMEGNPCNHHPMLVVEDNGGGMTPERIRQCMSLGYSAKSRSNSTIGRYGNGFKTSTMRLGADVIVFTKSKDVRGTHTFSVGMLSYTFLRDTGHEDIVVPMLDFEESEGRELVPAVRSTMEDWQTNLETINQWSPFVSLDRIKAELASLCKTSGTKIVIYNLWENDDGELELDFDTDPQDILLRGGKDDKTAKLLNSCPNSYHYLSYKYSLRSYASILYLKMPPEFRIVLRGSVVMHHSLLADLFIIEEIPYRPHVSDSKEDVPLVVTNIGFSKDAPNTEASGFCVYHKNRLVKPFWRVWSVAGSGGRGVVGVLEANFVEPAHDKQGFENTTVLQRLEKKLLSIQKDYWNKFSYRVGYKPAAAKQRTGHVVNVETKPPVPPRAEGYGPPYAPEGWRWRVGTRMRAGGFHQDVYFYPPGTVEPLRSFGNLKAWHHKDQPSATEEAVAEAAQKFIQRYWSIPFVYPESPSQQATLIPLQPLNALNNNSSPTDPDLPRLMLCSTAHASRQPKNPAFPESASPSCASPPRAYTPPDLVNGSENMMMDHEESAGPDRSTPPSQHLKKDNSQQQQQQPTAESLEQSPYDSNTRAGKEQATPESCPAAGANGFLHPTPPQVSEGRTGSAKNNHSADRGGGGGHSSSPRQLSPGQQRSPVAAATCWCDRSEREQALLERNEELETAYTEQNVLSRMMAADIDTASKLLASKDEQLAAKDEVLAAKDAEIAALTRRLRAKEEATLAMDEEIAALRAQLRGEKADREAVQDELQAWIDRTQSTDDVIEHVCSGGALLSPTAKRKFRKTEAAAAAAASQEEKDGMEGVGGENEEGA